MHYDRRIKNYFLSIFYRIFLHALRKIIYMGNPSEIDETHLSDIKTTAPEIRTHDLSIRTSTQNQGEAIFAKAQGSRNYVFLFSKTMKIEESECDRDVTNTERTPPRRTWLNRHVRRGGVLSVLRCDYPHDLFL